VKPSLVAFLRPWGDLIWGDQPVAPAEDAFVEARS